MRVITLSCENCGSIVAGNVLERYHRVSCPGVECDNTLRFTKLDESDREYLVAHAKEYRME